MKSRIECIRYLFRDDSSFSKDNLDINIEIFERVYHDLQQDESRLRMKAKSGEKAINEYHDFLANFDSLLEDWYFDELSEHCEHQEVEKSDESYFTPGPTGEGVEYEYQVITCKFCGKELEND